MKLSGHLFLTGLAELDSVPLAEKLAARPGALSFPYLKKITPEIAAALAKNERSLTLAGLTDVSPEVQEKLAETVGGLSLPNLQSIDVAPLEKKLAAGVVLLSQLKKLSPELAKQFTGVKGAGSFFGGVYLSLAAITPEVGAVFAESPNRFNLILVGSWPHLRRGFDSLAEDPLGFVLQDIETLTPEQIRIIATSSGNRTATPGILTATRTHFPV